MQIQKQIENEIFNQVNALRKSKGLKPFKRNNLLDKAAAIRSKEMLENQKFSHIRPNGETFYTTIQANNYKYLTAGENIAYLNGYPIKRIAAEMMDGWIKSLPHYQAMIDGAAESTKNGYVDFGISVYYQNGVAYGTQHFGHPF
ncbi:MAG: CAP domain-containing protein [Oscillospiraceae bacterium]